MSESRSDEQARNRAPAATDGPKVIREDELTQGTQVANLPHAEDTVDEAAEESFPASDPPAYTGRRDDRVDPTTETHG